MAARAARPAEVRTEHLLTELLVAQGWDCRRPPAGELLRQHEYRVHSSLLDAFRSASKSGDGVGLPEAVLVERDSLTSRAVTEAQAYGAACVAVGYSPLAIGIAGTSEDAFDLRVFKWTGAKWVAVT